MMKKLLDNVMGWFNKSTSKDTVTSTIAPVRFEASLRRQLLVTEYAELIAELKSADNLMQLLDIRKKIQQFQQLVLDNHEYSWGKQYIIDLHRIWKIKYTRWKRL